MYEKVKIFTIVQIDESNLIIQTTLLKKLSEMCIYNKLLKSIAKTFFTFAH